MTKPRKLTAAVARKLLGGKEALCFGDFTSLEDGAAELLAAYDGDLQLYGITSISLSALRSLAKHRGAIFLGIDYLSEKAAEALSHHHGFLNFTDLAKLSDDAANAISGHAGGLCFTALNEISQPQGAALSRTKGLLSFCCLQTFTTEVLSELAKHQAGLCLDGIEEVDIFSARALQEHQDFLELGAVGSISGAAAQALADKAGGSISLPGLESFSDTVAEALAKFRGDLFIDSVVELSDRAAGAFSTHLGVLSLCGLRRCTNDALINLHKCEGLRVNEMLANDLSRVLGEAEGSMAEDGSRILTKRVAEKERNKPDGFFGNFQHVTDEAAGFLVKNWKNRSISLDGLVAVTPGVAKALAKHAGVINLSKLEALSDE